MSPVSGLYTLTRENLDVGCYHFVLKTRWNVFLSHYSWVYLKPHNHHLLQALEPTSSQTLLSVPLWPLWQGPPTAVVILLHLLHLRLRALGSLEAILLLLCPSSTALRQSPNSHPAEFWINHGLLLYALKIFIWIKLSFSAFLLWLLNVFCKDHCFFQVFWFLTDENSDGCPRFFLKYVGAEMNPARCNFWFLSYYPICFVLVTGSLYGWGQPSLKYSSV